MSPSERLKDLGLSLPTPATPIATYVPYVITGNLLYVSGQGPRDADGHIPTGKVGRDVALDEAYKHARTTGLNVLAVVHKPLGDLGRVKRVVKLLGMVNAAPEFGDHPKVINGCSDLFVEALGEAGRHARSAVGMGALPNGIMVEIEAILLIRS